MLLELLTYFKPDRFIQNPYSIPNHITPEIFQWCHDKDLVHCLLAKEGEKLVTLNRMHFLFKTEDSEIFDEFKEYIRKNSFKFWRKKRKFEYNWLFKRKNEYSIHFKSNVSLQEPINDFFNFVLKINSLIGAENWASGRTKCSSTYDLLGWRSYGYLDDAIFFHQNDVNLFKLALT